MLADALQERDLQKIVKERQKGMKEMTEEYYLEQERNQMQEYDEREREKQRRREKERKQWKESVGEQQTEFIGKLVKGMQNDKIEGEIIKEKVAIALKEDQEKENQRRLESKKLQIQIVKDNELKKEYQRREQMKRDQEWSD